MYWTELYKMEESRASQRGDMLGPLTASFDRVVELAQLVEGFKLEPSEVELKGIGKELANSKAKAQTLTWPLIRSENPIIAGKAHELVREADEVASKGQKRIRKLLR